LQLNEYNTDFVYWRPANLSVVVYMWYLSVIWQVIHLR